MTLSTESRLRRWLVMSGVWSLVAILATFDALAMRDYVAMLDDSGTLAADSLPLQRNTPADYADALTWTRYALALEEGAPPQLRTTDIDNAPFGREVHWSSGFAHLIAAEGRVRAAVTREPLARATERALAWFNLPLFLAVVIVFSGWVARRAGAAAGVLIALGMLGHRSFYDGFAPNYVDHHGLLSAAAFGVVLGAMFMGAGWIARDGASLSILPASHALARSGALLSAISGGVGMSMSAASIIPTIAIVGIAGLAAAWWLGPRARDESATLDANLWRLWGRVGAAVAVVAYVLEYAPHHVGLRLEVNHPLYALAWLGGGELVAMLADMRVNGVRPTALRVVAPALAVVAPLVAIVIGDARVFVLRDPRSIVLHENIEEFLSLFSVGRLFGAAAAARFAIGLALALPVLLVFQKRRERVLIAFVSFVVAASVVMACWQVRWWLAASGPELCLLVLAIAVLGATWSERSRWLTVAVIGAVFVEQMMARIQVTRHNVAERAVSEADAMRPLFRDVAVALRESQPTGDIVLLASPDASTAIGYYGRFKTLASLYWENLAGLEAAGGIFSASTDDEARRLIQARHVTHIVVTSTDDFLDAFYRLAHPNASTAATTSTFGRRLFTLDDLPRWLRPIPFRPRADAARGLVVLLLQVVPDQTDIEALTNIGTAQLAMRDPSGAERTFRREIAGMIPERRADLAASLAGTAYLWKAHGLALRLYEEANTLRPSDAVRVNMAWILATSADDSVRNGVAALALSEPLVRKNPNDAAAVDALAASLAETGRFDDAVRVASRSVELARARGDATAEAQSRQRLASYRERRPWRQ